VLRIVILNNFYGGGYGSISLQSRAPDNVKGVVKLLKHKVGLIRKSSFKSLSSMSPSARRKRTESYGSYSNRRYISYHY